MGAREFVTKRLRAIGKSFEQSQAPPKDRLSLRYVKKNIYEETIS